MGGLPASFGIMPRHLLHMTMALYRYHRGSIPSIVPCCTTHLSIERFAKLLLLGLVKGVEESRIIVGFHASREWFTAWMNYCSKSPSWPLKLSSSRLFLLLFCCFSPHLRSIHLTQQFVPIVWHDHQWRFSISSKLILIMRKIVS